MVSLSFYVPHIFSSSLYLGWVTRRKKETAKNLSDLRKEIAKEEAAAARASKMNHRSNSSQNLRRVSSLSSTPTVDDDGFVEITRGSMKKVNSKLDMMSLNEEQPKVPPPSTIMRRSQSQPASMSSYSQSSSASSSSKMASKNILSPDKCSDKMKSTLKEYFVGGDTDDAILTVHEMVQTGSEGSIERGAKVVEGGVLLVLEMKKEHVEKCTTVLCRAFKEAKLSSESIKVGMNDPLEFLSDIEIDAPLAGNHLVYILAELSKIDAIELGDLLQGAPEYFRTDGKAATFYSKVLKAKGTTEPSPADMKVIEELMTDDDRVNFDSSPSKLFEDAKM